MVEIKQVNNKKEIKRFIEFPLKLYKNNPYFVPPLYADEKKMFKKDFVNNDQSKHVCFNAYREGKMVGRIQGILQTASNLKWGQKRVRFNRFDAIDDQEVADALFSAVENWAKEQGMTEVVGPLGFSDLEREGLLIEGFDQMSTFEEQYNYPYYQKLIENCGYTKEVDWNEYRLRLPQPHDDRTQRMSEVVMRRYNLHYGTAKNAKQFLNMYSDAFFDILDETYVDIYGTVPFTDGMKKLMIDNFKLIIDVKYVNVILDENEKVVAFGLCFPSLSTRGLQKSGGRLYPSTLVGLLHHIKHPKNVDLGLIGILPEYRNRGVSACIVSTVMDMMDNGIEYAETNLNLEDNYAVQNLWKSFDATLNKRRRAFVKTL